MTRECVTHHYACNCREAEFAAIKTELGVLRQRIESAPIYHIPTSRPTSEEGWLNVIDSVKAINALRGRHVRLVIDDAIQEVKK